MHKPEIESRAVPAVNNISCADIVWEALRRSSTGYRNQQWILDGQQTSLEAPSAQPHLALMPEEDLAQLFEAEKQRFLL